MVGKSVSKKKTKPGRPKSAKKSLKVRMEKVPRFCQLWALSTPKEDICRELNIKQTQYYNYVDAAEQLTQDFVIGYVDQGLVLLHAENMKMQGQLALKTYNQLVKLDEDISGESDGKIKSSLQYRYSHLLNAYNGTMKIYKELIDDTKIVDEAKKIFNSVNLKKSSER